MAQMRASCFLLIPFFFVIFASTIYSRKMTVVAKQYVQKLRTKKTITNII